MTRPAMPPLPSPSQDQDPPPARTGPRGVLRALRDPEAEAPPPAGLRAPRIEAPAPAPEDRPVAEPAPPARPGRVRCPPGAARPRLSKLTLRVLAVNVLALLILVAGQLYLGRYEERLIQAELEALRTEAMIFAGALAEGAVVGDSNEQHGLDPSMARQMVRRLYETTDTRTRLFGVGGGLIVDSRLIGGPGGTVEVLPLPPPDDRGWPRRAFDAVYEWVTQTLPGPSRRVWPRYEEHAEQRATDYRVVVTALAGDSGSMIWKDPKDGLVLGVAVPVQRLRAVLGAILVTRDNMKIEQAMQSVREDILKVFAVALAITVLLSIYLASTITRPIRRLAEAAEQVRRGPGRQAEIPDFTPRRDEIGDLSGSLRQMTAALWARMDAIERFAADVAHEIKNPLTSLRSAVETAVRIGDPERQRRLMAIILEDVERLNRLISDISDASRIDAELSRAEAEPVDLGAMLEALAELYRSTLPEGGPAVALDLPEEAAEGRLLVTGIEDRLVQVFRNLIANAISFSPPGGVIAIAARRIAGGTGGMIEVTVEDDGPGIPEGKLEAIFDRFYTERPPGEKFGTHSGLGLSISKQIVEAHQGRIFARNRETGRGARFTVRIPAQ